MSILDKSIKLGCAVIIWFFAIGLILALLAGLTNGFTFDYSR